MGANNLNKMIGGTVTRYVIDAHAALQLAIKEARVPASHKLLAPTLMRSQVLAMLFGAVRREELTRKDATQHLDYLRSLQIRLLGDRVLQRVAWDIALKLGWQDTFSAEYLALTKLQADALVTENSDLATVACKVVPVAPLKDLLNH
jgi:predicted nucleic acid-binding protein